MVYTQTYVRKTVDNRTIVRYTEYRTFVRRCDKMKSKSFFKVIVVLFLLGAIAVPFALKVNGKTPLKYEKVVVYPGDTLWSIAKEIKTENEDIRKIIYEIRKINKLDTAVILPGQELLVPVN